MPPTNSPHRVHWFIVMRGIWQLRLYSTALSQMQCSFGCPRVETIVVGYSNTVVGLLVMIPYVTGPLAMVVASQSSDRKVERRWHVAIPAIIAGAACVTLGATHSVVFVVVFLSGVVGSHLRLSWTVLCATQRVPDWFIGSLWPNVAGKVLQKM